jgi:hypothetical protein
VPFSSVSILTRKPGNAAIAALLVLACLWLFPGRRSARSRGAWSALALLVIALAATQNRGGLLGAVAGAAVWLAMVPNRLRLAVQAVAVSAVGLALASMLSLAVPVSGLQGRDFTASQLISNTLSLGGAGEPGNLGGTVEGRQVLWTRIYHKQVIDGMLVEGSGFGQNLALEVGVRDAGTDKTRNPHNSHLDILARMGLVGFSLWIAMWASWYGYLFAGCRRLARHGLHRRRQVAILSLSVATAILVSSIFDPQLEGPQVAVLLWTMFGIGVAATSFRGWFGGTPSGIVRAPRPGVPGGRAR